MLVYREGIGFGETVMDVTFIYVTVSDVKVSCSVYKMLDKSCAARLTEDWRYKLPVDNLYNIQVYINWIGGSAFRDTVYCLGVCT